MFFDPRKWKGSYFCSSQQSLYLILVCKSALLFCISPLQVLETKWLVKNFFTLYRPHFESKSTQNWCLSAQNRKLHQFTKEKSFFRLAVFEIWWKIAKLLIKSYFSGKRTNYMPKITVNMSLSHNNIYINHNENIIIFF